jgi:hypothetical protein
MLKSIPERFFFYYKTNKKAIWVLSAFLRILSGKNMAKSAHENDKRHKNAQSIICPGSVTAGINALLLQTLFQQLEKRSRRLSSSRILCNLMIAF